MEITEFSKATPDEQRCFYEKMRACDWDAGQYLGWLLKEEKFREVSGSFGEALILTDNGEVASYCTLVEMDEIDRPDMKPWIGFVYTFPEYRGRRCAGQLIEYAVNMAKQAGFTQVFVSSEEKGLYEKYGFTYICEMQSIHGYKTGVFKREM